jgi:hypothetical protein
MSVLSSAVMGVSAVLDVEDVDGVLGLVDAVAHSVLAAGHRQLSKCEWHRSGPWKRRLYPGLP